MSQQKVSFQELFGQVKEGGTYLIEDVHTSYWLRYGGGYRRRGTFIEFSKQLIDEMHAYHAEQRSLPVSEYTRSIPAIHFYDSIIVIEKRKREEPFRVESGKPSEKDLIEKTAFEHVKWEIKSRLLSGINRALRYFRLPGFIWK